MMSKAANGQPEAFKTAKSKEELMAMAKEAGVDLIQKPYDEISEGELAMDLWGGNAVGRGEIKQAAAYRCRGV